MSDDPSITQPTLPTNWLERVRQEATERLAKGKPAGRVYIAPEDADTLAGVPGSFGDGGLYGSVYGMPVLTTYRVRPGHWMVTA